MIVEDELMAQLQLKRLLGESFPDIEVVACADSVAQPVEYLEGAGVPAPESASALYDNAAYRLGAFWLDHRGFPERGSDAEFFGIGGIIHQLRGY